MTLSTRKTDLEILKNVIEFLKGRRQITRAELRAEVRKQAAALKVNAEFILEKIEQRFDKLIYK